MQLIDANNGMPCAARSVLGPVTWLSFGADQPGVFRAGRSGHFARVAENFRAFVSRFTGAVPAGGDAAQSTQSVLRGAHSLGVSPVSKMTADVVWARATRSLSEAQEQLDRAYGLQLEARGQLDSASYALAELMKDLAPVMRSAAVNAVAPVVLAEPIIRSRPASRQPVVVPAIVAAPQAGHARRLARAA